MVQIKKEEEAQIWSFDLQIAKKRQMTQCTSTRSIAIFYIHVLINLPSSSHEERLGRLGSQHEI